MTCKQCKYITVCMAQADGLGQVFDPNYDGEHGCTDFAPFTNADRIRSMNDEELEEGIRKLSLGYEPWCDHHCKMNGDDDCNRCLRSWLQQPAEPQKEDA